VKPVEMKGNAGNVTYDTLQAGNAINAAETNDGDVPFPYTLDEAGEINAGNATNDVAQDVSERIVELKKIAAGLQQLQQPVDLEKVIQQASSLSNTPIPSSPSPLMFNKLLLDPMEHLPRSPTPGRTLQKETSLAPEAIHDTEAASIHNQEKKALEHHHMRGKVIGSVTRKTSEPEPSSEREIAPTYNSPIAMYSQDNVNDVIQDYQAKGFTPAVPESHPPKKPVKEYNPLESSTYQAVVESEMCKPEVEVPAIPQKPFPQPAGNVRKVRHLDNLQNGRMLYDLHV
jgi:hypothetical protein